MFIFACVSLQWRYCSYTLAATPFYPCLLATLLCSQSSYQLCFTTFSSDYDWHSQPLLLWLLFLWPYFMLLVRDDHFHFLIMHTPLAPKPQQPMSQPPTHRMTHRKKLNSRPKAITTPTSNPNSPKDLIPSP